MGHSLMRRLILTLALVILSGCKNFRGPTEPLGPLSPDNSISTSASNWDVNFSKGVDIQPADTGWYFEFPQATVGSVHYVQTPFRGRGLEGKILKVTFEVESDNAQYDAVVGGDSNPAYVTLFLERGNYNLNNEDSRWWAGGNRYQLGSSDNHTVTLTVPLLYNHWTDVFGKTSEANFSAALNNLAGVGMTFGGASFYGHGVALQSGRARFHLIDYRVY